MADNIEITPGVGAEVATDEVGGVHYQVIKVAIGADGAVDGLLEQPLTDTQLRDSPVPVSLASLPALAAGTANIGDVDVASLPALPAGTNNIGATTDGGAGWASVFGVSGAAVLSANATGGVDVTGAPTAGQKLVITDIVVSTDTAMAITFEEETSGTDIFKVFLPANGTAQITPRSKCKLATADKKLRAVASVAGNIAVTVFYTSEN